MRNKSFKKIWHILLILLAIIIVLNLKFPTTYSFFTAGEPKEAEGFSFLFIRQEGEISADAKITISRPFLFEKELINAEEVNNHTNNFATDQSQTEDNYRQQSKKSALQKPATGETIEAEISFLDKGFDVDEIFIPSVKIKYKDYYSFALMSRVEESTLITSFDYYELWNWFQNISTDSEMVSLTVSGEGFKQDKTVYFFSGETKIELKGCYDVGAIQIVNPDILFISPEEPLHYQFKLVDQNGIPLSGARWRLIEGLTCVDLDETSGVLTAEYCVADKSIIVEATLESQGRFHSNRVTVKIKQLTTDEPIIEENKDDIFETEKDDLHSVIEHADDNSDTNSETDFGEEDKNPS